jgi:hypothetical protein
MHSKLTAKAILCSTAVLLFSQTAFAASHSGKITLYHLNNNIMGRGSCIQMNPGLPDTGWACVWEGRLYREFNDLFREAYSTGKTCTVSWSTNDKDGYHLVDVAQCQ